MARRSITAAALVLITAVAGAVPSAQAAETGDWGPVADLTRELSTVYSADVANGPRGKIVAAWVQGDGDSAAVHAARRLLDGSWADSARVPGTRGATESRAEVVGDGTIVLVWTTRRAVKTAQKVPGRAWTPPVLLHRTPTSLRFPSDLQVAVNARGRAGVAWQSVEVDVPGGDGANQIHAVVGKGERWSPTRDLSDPSRPAVSPEVAVDRTGRVTVVWNASDGRRWLVRTISWAPVTRWSRARALNLGADQPSSPDVAVTAAGDVAVAWALETPALKLVRWKAGSGWDLVGDTLPLRSTVWWHDLALDGDGTATLGWTNNAGAVWTASKPVDGEWARQRVAPAGTAYYGLELAVNRLGDAVLTWQAYGERDRDHPAQAAYRPRSSRWLAATVVSPASGDAFGPAVALAGDGDAVAVWAHQRDDRSGTRVQARSFFPGG